MDKLKIRLRAARMVGQLLSTLEGRKFLTTNGYKSGESIVTAGYEELIKDVMPRVRAHTPPVTIALLKGNELLLFTVEPSGQGERSTANIASAESTIGMLYEAGRQKHGKTFRINAWDTDTIAVSMPSASSLLTSI